MPQMMEICNERAARIALSRKNDSSTRRHTRRSSARGWRSLPPSLPRYLGRDDDEIMIIDARNELHVE